MLKVQVEHISSGGLKIDETLNLESLNTRVTIGKPTDPVFKLPPKVSVLITKTGGGALLKGRVHTTYTQPCGLCLDEVSVDIDTSINLVLQPAKKAATTTQPKEVDLSQEDDVSTVYYVDGEIDLEDLIQERLLLSLDPYVHCRHDCKGLCQECGGNLNQKKCNCTPKKATLGDLLSKAGVKVTH